MQINSKTARYGVIYKITNKTNGMVYIGQTVRTIAERFARHSRKEGFISDRMYIKKAIQKYGKKSFEIEELYVAFSKEELDRSEQYFINIFNTLAPQGYNLTSGGSFGNIPSADLRKRLSEIQRKNSKPFVSLNIETGTEKNYSCLTEAHKDGFNISQVVGILHKKPEKYTSRGFTFKYINESYPLGYNMPQKLPSKKTVILDRNNGLILEFNSLKETANYLKIDPSNVSVALNHNGISRKYFIVSDSDNHCPPFYREELKNLLSYTRENWEELCK